MFISAFFVSEGNLYKDYLLQSVYCSRFYFKPEFVFLEKKYLTQTLGKEETGHLANHLEMTLAISNLNNSNYFLSQTKF